MDEYKKFLKDVAEMRKLQKEYFRTRSPYVLDASKKQERLVDKEILELTNNNGQIKMAL